MRLPRLPSLPIAHQLALLIGACMVFAVLAVGGVSLWNLKSGFGQYLRQRDEEHLTRLMVILERRAEGDPQMEWLRGNYEAMRELQDDAEGLDPNRPPPPPRPDHPYHPDGPDGPDFDGRPPPPPWARPPERGMDAPPPPRPRPGGGLPGRLVIRDATGKVIAGHALPANVPRSERAIKLHGQVIGSMELAEEVHPEGIDAHFLQRQTTGLVYTAAGAIALALALAWWGAKRWAEPLRALQLATRRIAKGDLRVQVGNNEVPMRSSALEIDLLIGDVNSMAATLAALEVNRRTWIAQISHELRTPLSVLRGELEAIEDGARAASMPVIKGLHEEVLQLTRLVDDLHLLSMSDLGQLPCEFAPADADTSLHRWAQKYRSRAGDMGFTLDVQPADNQPGENGSASAINWDSGRIEQLLGNLLENSLRYTDAPGVIRVRWQMAAGLLTLVVEDSAPGVPPALYQRLFDPLFRVDASRSRAGGHGSGLGLSIVQAIARAHRGTVKAEASSLGGLRVQVVLPQDPRAWERRKET